MGAAVVNDRGIAQSFKTTFCLIDWVKIDAQKKTPDLFYFACDRNAPFQGVSVGWIDQYHHALEGQEIDLTGAPSGVYYLRVRVNDEGKFVESTTADNIAWRSFPPVAGQPGQPEDRVHLGLTVHQPEHVRQRLRTAGARPGPNTAGRRLPRRPRNGG